MIKVSYTALCMLGLISMAYGMEGEGDKKFISRAYGMKDEGDKKVCMIKVNYNDDILYERGVTSPLDNPSLKSVESVTLPLEFLGRQPRMWTTNTTPEVESTIPTKVAVTLTTFVGSLQNPTMPFEQILTSQYQAHNFQAARSEGDLVFVKSLLSHEWHVFHNSAKELSIFAVKATPMMKYESFTSLEAQHIFSTPYVLLPTRLTQNNENDSLLNITIRWTLPDETAPRPYFSSYYRPGVSSNQNNIRIWACNKDGYFFDGDTNPMARFSPLTPAQKKAALPFLTIQTSITSMSEYLASLAAKDKAREEEIEQEYNEDDAM